MYLVLLSPDYSSDADEFPIGYYSLATHISYYPGTVGRLQTKVEVRNLLIFRTELLHQLILSPSKLQAALSYLE